MLLDYLMIPLISAIIPALAIQRLAPECPLPLLTFLILSLMTLLNLVGIKATMRANVVLLIVASVAVMAFFLLAVRYLALRTGWAGVMSLTPIYNPNSFSAGAILSGISLAALTYIGFDGLTTLAEDSINPKHDMVLATVYVVLITGLLSGVELYFLHMVLPDWRLADPNTSYLDVMRQVGGPALFFIFLLVMSLSQFGAGFGVQVNAARLLYGMGRDRVLPPRIFGHLSPGRQSPSYNIITVGMLAFVGTVIIPFDQALDLLNFGAFLGYMAVNAAVLWSYGICNPVGLRRNVTLDVLLPIAGFSGCLIFWFGLPWRAKIVGSLWLLVGLIYCAYKTRGFRERPMLFDFQQN
jgi:putrescine importer